jgi:hypothetical protein
MGFMITVIALVMLIIGSVFLVKGAVKFIIFLMNNWSEVGESVTTLLTGIGMLAIFGFLARMDIERGKRVNR